MDTLAELVEASTTAELKYAFEDDRPLTKNIWAGEKDFIRFRRKGGGKGMEGSQRAAFRGT